MAVEREWQNTPRPDLSRDGQKVAQQEDEVIQKEGKMQSENREQNNAREIQAQHTHTEHP